MANPHPPNQDKLRRGGSPGRTKGSKNVLTRERIERELRYIALSDPIALFEHHVGFEKDKDGKLTKRRRRYFTLREIDAMPEEVRRAIASVKVRTENLTAGDGEQDTTVEVKLWEKTKALELCARTLGMLKDHVVVEDLSTRKDRLRVALARVPGADGD